MDLATEPETSGKEAFQVKKSKRNLAARQKEQEQRLDRSWQPQREDPVLESGNIHYEVSGRVQAVNYAVRRSAAETTVCNIPRPP